MMSDNSRNTLVAIRTHNRTTGFLMEAADIDGRLRRIQSRTESVNDLERANDIVTRLQRRDDLDGTAKDELFDLVLWAACRGVNAAHDTEQRAREGGWTVCFDIAWYDTDHPHMRFRSGTAPISAPPESWPPFYPTEPDDLPARPHPN